MPELGVHYDVVLYLKQRPDRATLAGIVDRLEGPVAGLVRKDSVFKRLGLDATDYVAREPSSTCSCSAPRCCSGLSSCAASA